MSYILEALKKSEQERNPDKVPDLSTHHRAVATEAASKMSWIWPVTILVIINLAVLYWFLLRDSAPAAATQVVPVSPALQAPQQITESQPTNTQNSTEVKPDSVPTVAAIVAETVVEKETMAKEEVSSNPASSNTISNSAPAPESEPVPVPEPVPQKPIVIGPPKFAELPHVTGLSQSIQNQLPAISFTTHIFVRDGGSFVIINNRNMSDGMSIGSGVVIEKIVREGVILSFRDRYFTLNSMESWQK